MHEGHCDDIEDDVVLRRGMTAAVIRRDGKPLVNVVAAAVVDDTDVLLDEGDKPVVGVARGILEGSTQREISKIPGFV